MTKLTVLVVDDEDRWLDSLEKLGVSLGFEVLKARNGDEAWNILEARPEIDVVITDVRMAPVDGVMVLHHIDAMRKGNQPKVLIHSNENTYYASDRTRLDLSKWVPEFFGEFAQFARKSVDLAKVRAFLAEILAARQ
ncbi:MAG: hypothetical protein RLZZ360_795 [Candidatus Parcubacteria bacterium]|jgi:CheY-like chemotaxis protein